MLISSKQNGRRIRVVAALGLSALAVALSAEVALGAPTDLDRSFGSNGKAAIDAGGQEIVDAIAVQPDGKVVGVGSTGDNPLVFRLNPDGSRDKTFDADGVVSIAGVGKRVAEGVAI